MFSLLSKACAEQQCISMTACSNGLCKGNVAVAVQATARGVQVYMQGVGRPGAAWQCPARLENLASSATGLAQSCC